MLHLSLKNLILMACILLFSTVSQADDWALHEAKDISILSQKSQKDHLPIVIYFNMKDCGACQKLKDNVITPLMNNGRFDGYIHMVQVTVDLKNHPIIDFYGDKSNGAQLKADYNITTEPTMVFLNSDGDMIASPMVRSGAYDYASYYIQQRINKALKALGNPKRINLD